MTEDHGVGGSTPPIPIFYVKNIYKNFYKWTILSKVEDGDKKSF